VFNPDDFPAMNYPRDLMPPQAPRRPHVLELHGDRRVDDYFWLRERDDPEVTRYLLAENAYSKAMLAHTETLQEKLYQEIVGRIKQEDQSVPYRDNGYWYLTRYTEGAEYPIHARKKASLDAPEEIMLDVNELARDHDFYQIGGMAVSPDNRLLAFAEDSAGRRIFTLRFKDLHSGEWLNDRLANVTGEMAWANDNRTLFYTLKDPLTLRGFKIMRHRLGQPQESDVQVYHEADETFLTYVYKSKSKKYIIIASYATLSQEYRVLEADQPEGDFRLLQARERGLEYHIAHYENRFYIRTNWQARNFRLMVTPEDAPAKENWTEVIPHREDVLLEDLDIFRDFLVLSERLNGITRIRVRPWNGEDEHYIDFEEEAYVAFTSVNPEFDTELLRLGYQSLTTPNSIFDYHMRQRSFTLLKQEEVLGGFDKNDYHSERIMATMRDGASCPISLVYRKGFRRDGSHPLLLYGYGSYGISMEPSFSSARLSLLDRGFVYAIAHVRGGEEMGRHWYENGRQMRKKNTFHDFIDCAERLLADGFSARDRLFAAGGSAGGLLIGAVINMRPELWRGVVAQVPFVDVLSTMLDDSIPLTAGEYDEWGNPNEKEYYDYIKSYSPYDNIAPVDYPAVLIITGLHDSQVQYWEPAKWAAKLRALKTGLNPVLLHTNMEAGHGGASGRFRRFREVALMYAFLLDLAGRA
jgi:oligopeptidase B